MVGVIPNTEGICLMIAQVFDERGENSDSFIDEAVEWCADNGARVINMSLGTTVSHKESKELYNKLWEEGIIVVAAAGNSGSSVKAYPASYDDVISVSAVDELNELAVFSSFNKQVNLAAPGVDILSTVGGKQISVEDGSGKEIDGDLMKYSVLPDEDDISDLEIVDCGQGFEKCKADGKVCLIERGETFFWEKAENCEKGKGVAALIYNNLDEALIGNLSRDHEIKIPVVSLSRQDGLALLESGGTMSLSIKPYGYYSMDGTSMAAPHVAGVAAKIWAARPECTNEQIREALFETALDLGKNGQDDKYGFGLVQTVDAYNYLLSEFEDPCGAPPTPEPTSAKTGFPTASASPTLSSMPSTSSSPTGFPTASTSPTLSSMPSGSSDGSDGNQRKNRKLIRGIRKSNDNEKNVK